MPSDLPLMSTGRATYPVPPQRGQSFGSTDPPQLLMSLSSIRVRSFTKLILLRNTNRSASASPKPGCGKRLGAASQAAEKLRIRIRARLQPPRYARVQPLMIYEMASSHFPVRQSHTGLPLSSRNIMVSVPFTSCRARITSAVSCLTLEPVTVISSPLLKLMAISS